MDLNHLAFNWFDVTVLALLFVGILRGRKRGLSQELFTMVLWVVLIFGCSMAYAPLGNLIASVTPFSKLFCYVFGYVVTAVAITLIFMPIKRSLDGKFISADSFGSAEYYVGMPAGALRFLCILVAFLAVLNARMYTRSEIAADEKYQKDMYGSEFFPGLSTLQSDVFANSFTGPYFKTYLDFLLITPTFPESKPLKRAEAKFM
jgi:uncharacterized membrane protein required for colicin V production